MWGDIRTAAFGLYPGNVNLEYVVDELHRVGFRSADVCLLLPRNHPASEAMRTLQSPDDGPGSARHIEKVVHWLARFGAVVIPGEGFFVAARDFVSSLFGSNHIARACDGFLHGLGIPEPDAHRYEDCIGMGGVLIYVDCQGTRLAQRASAVLHRAGAQEVSWVG